MSDSVDETEDTAIKIKGEKESNAKIDRIMMEILAKVLSSLERIDFIFHHLEQRIIRIDLPNHEIGSQNQDKANNGLIDTRSRRHPNII